jgi:hypothetical protein
MKSKTKIVFIDKITANGLRLPEGREFENEITLKN